MATSALITLNFSDGVEYLRFYMSANASKEEVLSSIVEFCSQSDIDTKKHRGRINWDYVATSMFVSLFTNGNISSTTTFENLPNNKVFKTVSPYQKVYVNRLNYNVTITPIPEKYQNPEIPLIEALEITVNGEVIRPPETPAISPSQQQAINSLKSGHKYPYDPETPIEAIDWAHTAARGVINDLRDRRGIKNGFEDVDSEIKSEITHSLAEIIRTAGSQPFKEKGI